MAKDTFAASGTGTEVHARTSVVYADADAFTSPANVWA